MGFRIADRWFDFRRVDDDITLIREPHVVPLIRCNIWHVRGRDRDLLIDTGLGMASLTAAARDLFGKKLTAVATHAHYDHVGGFHEFEDRVIHGAEARKAAEGNAASLYGAGKSGKSALRADLAGDALLESIRAAGYDVPAELFTAVPADTFDPRSYSVLPAPATRTVTEGDIIDTGDRHFESCICRAIRREASGYGRRKPGSCSPAMRSMTGRCSISCQARTLPRMSRP